MSEFPTKANVVVIGAGIVGNCLVGHLADLGWTDIVLLDKGPLPNPGGSTGHASNFIFPIDHNKEIVYRLRPSGGVGKHEPLDQVRSFQCDSNRHPATQAYARESHGLRTPPLDERSLDRRDRASTM